jgi:hypothetical protein
METEETFYPICQHVENSKLYRYKGEDHYENVLTGEIGKVSPGSAKRYLAFLPEVSEYDHSHPLAAKLIATLIDCGFVLK